MSTKNTFNACKKMGDSGFTIFSLKKLHDDGIADIGRLPFSIKILLESVLRNENGVEIQRNDIIHLANWKAKAKEREELPFKPARVVLQDFTGVPAIVDLAALRSAAKRLGGNPKKINPQIPVDLVIDHSVQVDHFGSCRALEYNAHLEFKRNRERYEFLKWATQSFKGLKVVPPATGIVHQVNLEYLGTVVLQEKLSSGEILLFPDTLVGTDSHTPMINGLGIVGWGVGGIEAEATMLGQPYYMLTPDVVGFRLTGELQAGVTATDLVLTVTQMLRQKGVVGKFVEFYGPSVKNLTVADRATISNMSPEYGATVGFFPVDDETLNYLRSTGRSEQLVKIVERYCKEQGLFHTTDAPEPEFSYKIELDISTVVSSIAGPKRPQDRVALKDAKKHWHDSLTAPTDRQGFNLNHDKMDTLAKIEQGGVTYDLKHGAVVIAAITSCTNTSNPAVMLGAGLLAKKAVEAGLKTKPWVKTSLAPGSKVVTQYLKKSGLLGYLEGLGFHVVGYGCTTCIGNSGSLPKHIQQAIRKKNLVACAILSGNRNFEGRINPDAQASFLVSPILVVAYAIAGSMNVDLTREPLGTDPNGQPVYLKDVWPGFREIQQALDNNLDSKMFEQEYGNVLDGNKTWNKVSVPKGEEYEWDEQSDYIQEPPFFKKITPDVPSIQEITGAKVLAWLPDSTTTDHISPAGAIANDSPAGRYLIGRGVQPVDFNTYGSRRGNHEVMMRGTLANIRIKNKLIPGVEGGYTIYQPDGEQFPMWDAAVKYMKNKTPLIILAGKEYGSGSSRDWAAKGVYLQGVKAVIAESYERIHRSNLVGMGILPLQFKPGESVEKLGLSGFETFDILGLNNDMKPGMDIQARATNEKGLPKVFNVTCRIDSPVEVDYYKNGGILHTVLRQRIKNK